MDLLITHCKLANNCYLRTKEQRNRHKYHWQLSASNLFQSNGCPATCSINLHFCNSTVVVLRFPFTWSLLQLISIKTVALLNLRHQNSCVTPLLTIKLANQVYKLFIHACTTKIDCVCHCCFSSTHTNQCILFTFRCIKVR